MSTVQPTDKTLVNRAGVDHSAPADMSTVQDTDLLLINRAGVDYKCTFLDWKNSQSKPPDVDAVTLADVPGGARFTSVAFPVSATLVDDGIPTSTKKLKAYVEGTLKTAAQTSAITAVTSVQGPRTYKVHRSPGGLPSYALPGFAGSWSMDHAGNVGDGFFAPSATTTQVIEVPAGTAYWTFASYQKIDLVNIKDSGYYVSNSLSGPWTLIPLTAAGLVIGVNYPVSGYIFAGFSSPFNGWIGASQVLSLTDSTYTTLTLADNTQLTNFAAHDAITEVGNGDDATGKVGAVDVAAKTITLDNSAGTWDVGSAVKGPMKTQIITPKTSAITNVAGNVLTLTDTTDLANFHVGDAVQGVLAQPTNVTYRYLGTAPNVTQNGWANGVNETTQALGTPPPDQGQVNAHMVKLDRRGRIAYYNTGHDAYFMMYVSETGSPNSWVRCAPCSVLGNSTTPIESDRDGLYFLVYRSAGAGDGCVTDAKAAMSTAGYYAKASGIPSTKVTAITPATPSITVDGGSWSGTDGTSSGTLAAREGFVTGPTRPAANVKLFCKLDAAGAVSDLQSADPGFTAWTPAGTGPYTGTVTFPATLPTGKAPDADLPAGTTITVEVEASNTAGTDSAKSNTVTPA